MKKLKQEKLFYTLQKMKVKAADYLKIYMVHQGLANEKVFEQLPTEYLDGKKLSLKGLAVIEEVDKLFLTVKSKAIPQQLKSENIQYVEKYLKLFPSGILPNGKRAISTKPEVLAKFKRFFDVFNYSWDIILEATDMYVTEYEAKRYDKMRTAAHFSVKKVGEETFYDLSEYCERVIENQKLGVIPNKTIPKKSHGRVF